MPSSMKLGSISVETSGDMEHVLGQERSSGQQKSVDVVREKTPSPLIEKATLFQGKHRVRHSFSQPYLDRGFESTENASAEKVKSRSSGNERKPQLGGRVCDDNELVKHMSNLPGFLQQVEKEKTIQGKALSFGVLDWKRLEKWKYTERMPGRLSKKTFPSGDSFVSASGLPKVTPNLRKQPPSHSRYPSLSYSDKQQAANDLHFSSPQQPPPQSLYLKSSKDERNGSYRKEEEYVECLKSKGKETCNQKYPTAESIKIGRQQYHFQQTGKFSDQIHSEANAYKSKRNPRKEMMSERDASSSKQEKHKNALLSPNKVSDQGKKSTISFDEVKLTSECSPADPQNILLLMPNDAQKKICSGSSQISESRASLDVRLPAATQNRFSDFCSPQELYSGEYSVDIPHSCPLTSSAVDPYKLSASSATDSDICPNADSVTSISSEAKISDSDVSEETVRPSIFGEASNRKQVGVGEQPAVKGRSPSPTRRFSFNLGRMTRSFSFKESSGVPQLSSAYTTVKSGPVRPEAATSMDNFERDQANASNRSRSSPLRRLLDPLLKHKTSSDTARPLNGSLRSTTASPTGTKGLPQDRKPEVSTFQALLQLTFKNGLPFFRLVVENSKDMLAAAVKRLPTSEKIDPCMIYSFYSVHEIKKKSMNWISPGSKSKSCSLGYSIIGQMKISNFYHPKVKRGNPGECDARECVLYGVDPGQVDKQMLAFVPNKEIAAIVVKNPRMPVGRRFPGLVSPVTKENSNSTVVILPGAVHGIPIKGAPSSLISRWRSGGMCDCGGWDVGCKLQILADSGEESLPSSIDHVNLFIEGAEQKSRPVLSLKRFSDEFYSIELDASISLLEAFATSVAYLTTQKIPEIIDAKSQSEAEHVVGANAGSDKRRTPSFQEQAPARYFTCPPLSPVGRI